MRLLLHFSVKKIVCTKWRIYGHFGQFQTPATRNFARMQRVRIVVFFNKVTKKIYRALKWEKNGFAKEKKSFPVFFFTKSNCSEQNISRNRHLKIPFERCSKNIFSTLLCKQKNPQKIKTYSNSLGMF